MVMFFNPCLISKEIDDIESILEVNTLYHALTKIAEIKPLKHLAPSDKPIDVAVTLQKMREIIVDLKPEAKRRSNREISLEENCAELLGYTRQDISPPVQVAKLVHIMKQDMKNRGVLWRPEYEEDEEYLKDSMNLLMDKVCKAIQQVTLPQIHELIRQSMEIKNNAKLPRILEQKINEKGNLIDSIEECSFNDIVAISTEMDINPVLQTAANFEVEFITKIDTIIEKIISQILQILSSQKKADIPIKAIHDSLPPPAKNEMKNRPALGLIDSSNVAIKSTFVDNLLEIREVGIQYVRICFPAKFYVEQMASICGKALTMIRLV
jgi:hypothetical protein